MGSRTRKGEQRIDIEGSLLDPELQENKERQPRPLGSVPVFQQRLLLCATLELERETLPELQKEVLVNQATRKSNSIVIEMSGDEREEIHPLVEDHRRHQPLVLLHHLYPLLERVSAMCKTLTHSANRIRWSEGS